MTPAINPLTQEGVKKAKHLFMTYRNGVVADTLRHAGLPHAVIFGLQLPQITQIAATLASECEEKDCRRNLAMTLWHDTAVRESRLLACRLYPREMLTAEDAEMMALGVLTREEADILAFSLLRYLENPQPLLDTLDGAADTMVRYTAEALRRNLD